MSRVYAIVEGQTEESFVRDVLTNHLANLGVYITPILLTTKRVKNRNAHERTLPGRRFKGGVSSYTQVKRDIRNVLNDRNAVATTMIDFYGLPHDFPGMDNLPSGSGLNRVQHLELALSIEIDSHRFRPFLTLHEYEGLLFSDTKQIGMAFPEQSVTDELAAIKAAFSSPEEINQGQETHPAARIMSLITGYQKPFHGALIAKRIGLNAIRKECPHFDEWVTWLESLSS